MSILTAQLTKINKFHAKNLKNSLLRKIATYEQLTYIHPSILFLFLTFAVALLMGF